MGWGKRTRGGGLAAAVAAGIIAVGGVTAPASAEPAAAVGVLNGGFEDWTAAGSWVAADWAMTAPVWVTDAAAHSGTYSQALNQWNDSTTLSQTLAVPQGAYDVSLFVWANESLEASSLVVNEHSVPLASGGATQIDGSKTWDEIRVENVPVGADGLLEIKIVLAEFASATLTGFIDDVTVTPSSDPGEEPEPADSLLNEPGFEADGASWQIGGELTGEGHGGSAQAVRHSGDGTQETAQVVQSLAEGYYTLTAWVQNDGGNEEAVLFAAGGGASEAKTAIPRTNFPYDGPDTWKKTTLRGVHVTSGVLEVGLRTTGADDGSVRIDDLALVAEAEPYELLIGGDISTLTYTEDSGGRYSDAAGRERDPLQILADSGWNIVRIRVYNDPGKGRGDGSYYVPKGYVNAEDALDLARRAADVGLKIQLSFHYSDYWTNPGTQMIPHAWQDLIQGKSDADAVSILEREVHAYTKSVLDRMAEQGTSPEYVSIGNETRSGMLFPYGTTGNWPNLARFYNAGAEAVRASAPGAKVIIHLDDGGNTSTYRTYFTNAENRNVDYDIIGTSYYPYWTNKSAPKFAEFATTIAQQFDKPIMVMETGFNWRAEIGAGLQGQLENNGPYGGADTSSPQLQRDFMIELFNELQGVPGGMAIGDLYWDPIQIFAGGQTGWAYFESTDAADVNVIDNTTLFDFDGAALPALDAYRQTTRGSETGTVAGHVSDAEGRPVAGASVAMSSGQGVERTATTNEYGDYYFARAASGTYSVRAEKSGVGTASIGGVSARAGERVDGDLRLSGSQSVGTITGTVRADDVGVVGALLELVGDDYRSTRLSGAGGLYEFPSVLDGVYTLTTRQDGYVTRALEVRVAGGSISQNVDLVADVGEVSGKVLGPGRQPLSGATVTVGDTTVMSDSDGSFVLSGVPSGAGRTVSAVQSGYLPTSSAPITVEQGQTTSGVEIVLPAEIAVSNGSFELADSAGETLAAGWSFTSSPGGAAIRQNREPFGGTEDGQYAATFWLDDAYDARVEQSIAAAAPGSYTVRASVYSGVTGTLRMYLMDAAGKVLAEQIVPRNSGPQQVEVSADVSGSRFSVGFAVDGAAGDWAVVDVVSAGYLGPSVWADSTVYRAGDRVTHEGREYLATWYTRRDVPDANPNGPWQEIARTSDGQTAWTASRVFRAGDTAVYKGRLFMATWYSRTETPGSPTGPWQELESGADGVTIWTASRIFTAGDVVSHRGRTFTAQYYSRNEEPGTGGAWMPAN